MPTAPGVGEGRAAPASPVSSDASGPVTSSGRSMPTAPDARAGRVAPASPDRPAAGVPAQPASASRITEVLAPSQRHPSAASAPPAPPATGASAPAPARARRAAQPLPPEQPARGAVVPAETPAETTTRLRPVRDGRPAPARPTDAPAPGPAPTPAYAYDPWALSAETPAETTTRLRPVRERSTGRVVAAAVCAVLALGLVGGAVTGAVLAGTGAGEAAEPPGYTPARALWHNAPVDTLFPRTLPGPAAGPGGSARTWTRIVVAPDAPCTAATLPKALHTALRTVGCERVLRATYTDATSSHVTTVALVFTQADPATMRTLGSRAADEPAPALPGPGTVAERFGDRQRASWWRHILTDLPVVVTAVSGFADGRAVAEPEPADRAMTPKRTTPVAQAGLGHEAKGVGDAVERALRKTVAATVREDQE
ncbi:hypothetical protein ABZ135_13570 [Streptomyces sp. NPDC006339]|uniref:hypothetical protein n=1 Tax=Streptomyces sp. NPDC006339 TaxID=3156755 RepID=UPI0033A68FC6